MFSIQVGFEQRKRFQARAMEIQHAKVQNAIGSMINLT
jgi:hypothetical protein